MDNIIPQDDMPRKQCSNPDCKKWYPATPEFFPHDKKRKDGLYPRCKVCERERAKINNNHPGQKERFAFLNHRNYEENKAARQQKKREWKQQNREQNLAWNRQYAREHREERAEYGRQYRKDHAEHLSEYSQRFKQEHPDYYPNYHRQWGKVHKDLRCLYAHRRRALKKSAEGYYTPQDIQDQFKRQKGKCYYCKVKLEKYHIDHIMPIARGGSNWPSNLVLACPFCNQSKGDRLLHEWIRGGRLL